MFGTLDEHFFLAYFSTQLSSSLNAENLTSSASQIILAIFGADIAKMSSTSTAEELQAAAYETSSFGPYDLGLPIQGLIYFFSSLSTVFVALRSWVRFYGDRHWGWDDDLLIVAYVSCHSR